MGWYESCAAATSEVEEEGRDTRKGRRGKSGASEFRLEFSESIAERGGFFQSPFERFGDSVLPEQVG